MSRTASQHGNGATRPRPAGAASTSRARERAPVTDAKRATGDSGTRERSPVSDAKVAAAAQSIRDLGERRRSADAVRASEQLHRSIVETLDEGVMVQDRNGRVVAFNKSALRILGLSAEQLNDGSSYQPLIPLIHEDGSPFHGHEHPSMVSLRTGEPQTGVVMGVKTGDGTVRWISINSRALRRGGESEPYAAVGSFTDITAHRNTLEELHAARLADLKRLALVGEYRDDDTNRHTERVARTSALLAEKLGLESELVVTIRRAAPLHDVGKIGISDTILLKPGRLTTEEFETMKAHTHDRRANPRRERLSHPADGHRDSPHPS